ncbi:hypothetical protein FLAG1_11119 [Fusarium langsethiae]|uniref:Uncharacterized protein n=1 Tax=Fusarium langsethiae TaxID=179993 RepID=A0A0M9EN54_FUSLA|nr:hypothetical protein FLAG1_11119 [Fusarium langsethiae]
MTDIHQEVSPTLHQYSWLEKLHLHFNLPEPAIICTLCGYALASSDDRVGRHLGEKHHISKTARQKLNTLVNSLNLPSPEKLPKRQDGSAPHPNLRIQDGKACHSINQNLLPRGTEGNIGYEFKRCVSFWLRVWRLPPTVSRSILGRSLSKPQQMMLEELWLDSCWDEPNNEVDDLYNTAADIGEEDVDSELEDDIMSEFSEYASSISEASEIESSSDEEPNLESQRGRHSSPQVFGEDTNYTATHMSSSRETCDSYDRSVDVVLRFFYQAVIEDFEDGMSSSTLLVYFSAVRGLSGEGGDEYLRPARYTPILSRLIYCTRLIFLEAILPRRAHPYAGFAARPRYGQLAALNAIRADHMCDGTPSPLGEFFSLLAYGMTLQRSEGPRYHFDWSEDGQTVSWDGNMRLSMAYAILRRCFGHESQSTLIFTPISKNTKWTTRIFTEELKRLGRDVLGTDVEIGVQLYRQLSIAITERHIRGALPTFDRFDDMTAAADPGVAFAWQSGHRPKQ